jgi:hypothetical protein
MSHKYYKRELYLKEKVTREREKGEIRAMANVANLVVR